MPGWNSRSPPTYYRDVGVVCDPAWFGSVPTPVPPPVHSAEYLEKSYQLIKNEIQSRSSSSTTKAGSWLFAPPPSSKEENATQNMPGWNSRSPPTYFKDVGVVSDPAWFGNVPTPVPPPIHSAKYLEESYQRINNEIQSRSGSSTTKAGGWLFAPPPPSQEENATQNMPGRNSRSPPTYYRDVGVVSNPALMFGNVPTPVLPLEEYLKESYQRMKNEIQSLSDDSTTKAGGWLFAPPPPSKEEHATQLLENNDESSNISSHYEAEFDPIVGKTETENEIHGTATNDNQKQNKRKRTKGKKKKFKKKEEKVERKEQKIKKKRRSESGNSKSCSCGRVRSKGHRSRSQHKRHRSGSKSCSGSGGSRIRVRRKAGRSRSKHRRLRRGRNHRSHSPESRKSHKSRESRKRKRDRRYGRRSSSLSMTPSPLRRPSRSPVRIRYEQSPAPITGSPKMGKLSRSILRSLHTELKPVPLGYRQSPPPRPTAISHHFSLHAAPRRSPPGDQHSPSSTPTEICPPHFSLHAAPTDSPPHDQHSPPSRPTEKCPPHFSLHAASTQSPPRDQHSPPPSPTEICPPHFSPHTAMTGRPLRDQHSSPPSPTEICPPHFSPHTDAMTGSPLHDQHSPSPRPTAICRHHFSLHAAPRRSPSCDLHSPPPRTREECSLNGSDPVSLYADAPTRPAASGEDNGPSYGSEMPSYRPMDACPLGPHYPNVQSRFTKDMRVQFRKNLQPLVKVLDKIRHYQSGCPYLTPFMESLASGSMEFIGIYTLDHGILCILEVKRQYHPDRCFKVVVPSSHAGEVLRAIHSTYEEYSMLEVFKLIDDLFSEPSDFSLAEFVNVILKCEKCVEMYRKGAESVREKDSV